MKKTTPEKNSMNLRSFGILALSMLCAVLALVFFKEAPDQDLFNGVSTGHSLASTISKKSFVRKRQFKDIQAAPAKKEASSVGSHTSASTQSSSSSSSSSDFGNKKELDTKLENAQDLVDSGEMDSIMKAKELLEEILAADPNHNGSIKELAMIHLYDLDEPNKAQDLLEKSYDLHPDDTLVFSETLQLATENGRLDQFTNKVLEKRDRDPGNPKFAEQHGYALSKAKDHSGAGRAFEQAADISGSGQHSLSAARSYAQGGDQNAAVSVAQRHIRLYESKPNPTPEETRHYKELKKFF